MALKNVYNKIYNKNLLYLLFEKLHLPIQKKKSNNLIIKLSTGYK